jgi:hypothetical protein
VLQLPYRQSTNDKVFFYPLYSLQQYHISSGIAAGGDFITVSMELPLRIFIHFVFLN